MKRPRSAAVTGNRSLVDRSTATIDRRSVPLKGATDFNPVRHKSCAREVSAVPVVFQTTFLCLCLDYLPIQIRTCDR